MKKLLLALLIIITCFTFTYQYYQLRTSVKLRIFHAGSLTVPFYEISKKFEMINPEVEVICEPYGSIEAVRQLIELNRKADIIAVSDFNVISELMFPEYACWYLIFARNEIVLAYANKSKFSDDITQDNWYEILAKPEVRIGRSDPNLDPCGYRTLFVWKLAEKYYDNYSIYEVLKSKNSLIKPKETDLMALLETGSVDYAFLYLSLVLKHKLRYLKLSDKINLGNAELASFYSEVNVTIQRNGKSVTIVGMPILYALTIPRNAPNGELAINFIKLLLSEEGRDILRECYLSPVFPAITNNISSIPVQIRTFSKEK